VIVPSAGLAALPFEALVVESENPRSFADVVFVLDRFELTYGPSSPVLVELASIGPRREGGKVLLLADPRYASEPEDEPAEVMTLSLLGGEGARALPDPSTLVRLPKTREEAFALADRLVASDGEEVELALARLHRQRSGSLEASKVDLFLGSEVSRARLASDLRGYAVLHFACHGFIDPEFPQRSGLALSASPEDAGWFTIGDALELDLDANLVVLSACETARGEPKAGEGVESLARAFLDAGARAVVASLWQVGDWAAAETMQGFYEGALERGLPPARALREAKLALRRSMAVRGVGVVSPGVAAPPMLECGHPFFWAPFIHVGLGR
jgi:CHAT domain-containing protein